MNNDLKLIALYDKIDGKLRELREELTRVEKQEGPTGPQGLQGPKGEQGDRGKDGVNGKDGRNGVDGKDGIDGADGTSITEVELDFDNHLRVTLSNGTVIDAGEINIPEGLTDEAIQSVVYHSGGGSQGNPVFIQDTKPTHDGPYMWVQTNYTDSGCMTFWIEDGQ